MADIVNGAIFHEGHNEMVIVKDIDIFSLCEHHLVPFNGKVCRRILLVPYSPVLVDPVRGRQLTRGPRCTSATSPRTRSSASPSCRASPRCSAAGYRIQERLTKEVATAIMEVLKPQGVAVVMESAHLCMVMRGVEKTAATTITSCVLGCFEKKEDEERVPQPGRRQPPSESRPPVERAWHVVVIGVQQLAPPITRADEQFNKGRNLLGVHERRLGYGLDMEEDFNIWVPVIWLGVSG